VEDYVERYFFEEENVVENWKFVVVVVVADTDADADAVVDTNT
jgi:hypothetical protein